MPVFVVVLLVVLILFILGFAVVKFLLWVAIVMGLIWLIGFFARGAGGGRWYRW